MLELAPIDYRVPDSWMTDHPKDPVTGLLMQIFH